MDKPVIRVPSNLEGPAFSDTGLMMDGFANFVSRIGTGADRASFGHYTMSPYAFLDVEGAYRTSWFRKICDIPAFDQVREGRQWGGLDKEDVIKLDKAEKKLGLMQKLAEAEIRARKDGGSAILISTGGDASRPLLPDDLEKVKKDGLRFITVCSRMDISPQERDDDPESPTFDQPRTYRLRNSGGTVIHASRVIRFLGNPIRQLGYWDGWGESIWVEMRDAVRHVDQISAGISAMVDEAKLDVVKIKNLISGMATAEYETALLRRWQSAMGFKSINNTLLLDDTDSYEQKTLTFQGLPDILAGALMIMSGMADIPATRLLGRAPQGMNATGDSDMRNYYDRIRARQQFALSPALETLDQLIVRSTLGDYPEEVYSSWNPLYSMSEKEAADVEKTFADAAKIYADTDMLPEPALAKMVQDGIVERGQWPGAEKAFDEAEKEGELPPLLEEPSEAELAEEAAKVAVANQVVADPAGAVRPKPKLVAANDARSWMPSRGRCMFAATW
jgi:phage-related protein (TIGR01555 family)